MKMYSSREKLRFLLQVSWQWVGVFVPVQKKHCLNYSHRFSSLGYLSNKIWDSKYIQGLSCDNSFLWLKFLSAFPFISKATLLWDGSEGQCCSLMEEGLLDYLPWRLCLLFPGQVKQTVELKLACFSTCPQGQSSFVLFDSPIYTFIQLLAC